MSEIYLGKPNQKIIDWCKDKYSHIGPLCFSANEANASVRLTGYDKINDTEISIWCYLQYSTDNKANWNNYTNETIQLSQCVGKKVYFKADPNQPNINGFALDYGNKYHKFIIEGSVAASGNIQYLLISDGSSTDVPAYCYSSMFSGCTSLTKAPALPATTLADLCYSEMFSSCTALTQAPELPATTLAQSCYASMFFSCTSLSAAPELPAIVLIEGCYDRMFSGCTSLTQAPYLPATTLTKSCYKFMFNECKKLSSIEVNFSVWNSENDATVCWLSDAGIDITEKTFTCPADLPTTRGDDYIPNGWVIVPI